MKNKLVDDYLQDQLTRLQRFGERSAIDPADFLAALTVYIHIVNMNAEGYVGNDVLETADSALVEIIRLRQGTQDSSGHGGVDVHPSPPDPGKPRNGPSTQGGQSFRVGLDGLPICEVRGEPLSASLIRERR